MSISDGDTDLVIQELQEAVDGELRNNYEGAVEVFDQQGGSHMLKLKFTKQDDNLWNMDVTMDPSDGLVVQGARRRNYLR